MLLSVAVKLPSVTENRQARLSRELPAPMGLTECKRLSILSCPCAPSGSIIWPRGVDLADGCYSLRCALPQATLVPVGEQESLEGDKPLDTLGYRNEITTFLDDDDVKRNFEEHYCISVTRASPTRVLCM